MVSKVNNVYHTSFQVPTSSTSSFGRDLPNFCSAVCRKQLNPVSENVRKLTCRRRRPSEVLAPLCFVLELLCFEVILRERPGVNETSKLITSV